MTERPMNMPEKTKIRKLKSEKIENKSKEMKEIKKNEKNEDKKENIKKEFNKQENKIKKTEAVVNGKDIGISRKHAVALCNFIRNMNIEEAMIKLENVLKMKIPVPMKGEIPHRKGRIMSGRYPLNAVREFLILLKSLKSNAINHELELEKMKLFCMANRASRPMKRFGKGRHKRVHVQIKLIPIGGKDN
jgi:ribosomal protein L22